MAATNTNVYAVQVSPIGGATNDGVKVGYVLSGAKAAQNDTWTVKNASKIIVALLVDDSTGAQETYTASTNVITLTSATTGAKTGIVLYK